MRFHKSQGRLSANPSNHSAAKAMAEASCKLRVGARHRIYLFSASPARHPRRPGDPGSLPSSCHRHSTDAYRDTRMSGGGGWAGASVPRTEGVGGGLAGALGRRQVRTTARLPLVAVRAGLRLFVSAARLAVCARLGGVGKPEAANQQLGLEKCLEVWTFSLETLAHLGRTSLPGQRPSPPAPSLPHAHSLSPGLPLPGHLDLVVLAFPQLPFCVCSPARAQTHPCSWHPPCGPLYRDHLALPLTDP